MAATGEAIRLRAARAALVTLLGGLGEAVDAQSLVRCPYRDREDRCTHRGPCANRLRAPGQPSRCAGGPLDPRRAAASAP